MFDLQKMIQQFRMNVPVSGRNEALDTIQQSAQFE